GQAGRQRRRGPLVGAAAAVLVALVGLGAALGAARHTGENPAVKLPTTSPTVAPSGPQELPAANEQVSTGDPGRPDRPPVPGNSPSASVSTTPSTQPSQTTSSPTPTGTPTGPTAPTGGPTGEPSTPPTSATPTATESTPTIPEGAGGE
ncbi:serine/threonine protein kinase, partial [Micromonospora sp. NPDC002411]